MGERARAALEELAAELTAIADAADAAASDDFPGDDAIEAAREPERAA